MISKKNRLIYVIIWVLIGSVLAFSVTGILLSGKGSIYAFYNVGDVYEINETAYKMSAEISAENPDLEKVFLDEGKCGYVIRLFNRQETWNYLCLNLKDVQSEKLQGIFVFDNEKDNIILSSDEKAYFLEEGMNILKIPDRSFNILRITIWGDTGDSFRIKSMQLRETKPVFSWGAAMRIFFPVCAAYGLISFILLVFYKKMHLKLDFYGWVSILQEIYILIAEKIRGFTENISILKNKRKIIRMFLFCCIFLYNVLIEMRGTYVENFKYHLVVYGIIIFLLACCSLKTTLKKQNWNNVLVWSWILLWGMACVSDFVVTKDFRFTGYMMVFDVGFFFFIWNNMENRHEVIEDFVRAVHLFWLFIVFFCLFFRPETEGMRYSGISKNPSIFALYLGAIWAIVLGEAEHRLITGQSNRKILPFIIEGCTVAVFTWKTQSAGPLLCMAVVSFVWFLRMIVKARKTGLRKRILVLVISFIVLLVPAYLSIDWGLNHISQKFGSGIVLENEYPVARQEWGMVVKAADLKDKLLETRLGQKFASSTFSGIVSGRDYYYRTYLRNMNLFGHKENPIMWGHRRLPHNAVLGIAYRYGVFAAVPYIIMLGAVLIRTFRYGNKNVKYAGVPFLICLISILMSMTDNVERPFIWLPWIGLYLMMGVVFSDESEQNSQK